VQPGGENQRKKWGKQKGEGQGFIGTVVRQFGQGTTGIKRRKCELLLGLLRA
jgi:hypothetical protein